MSKSLWGIAVIGFLATLMLVLGMWMSLASFEKSPGATRTKLAEQIRTEFRLDIVSTEVRADESKTYLRVYSDAKTDSKLDPAFQNQEMDKIAQFAMVNYKGSDRSFVDEIKVTRTEIKGSGCFQNTYVAHHQIPNTMRNLRPTREIFAPEK